MAFRYAPKDMYRLAASILLKDKNAWPFPKLRVVLHQDRSMGAVEHISSQNTIICKFIIAVIRNTNIPRRNERLYSGQRVTHKS